MSSLSVSSLKVVTSAEQFQQHFVPPTPSLFTGGKIVVFARHGESVDNASKPQIHSCSASDCDLTAKGITQARQVGMIVSKVLPRIDHIFVSDMRRARQTADGIMEAYSDQQKPLYTESTKLRERGAGIFEGKPLEEFEENCNLEEKARTLILSETTDDTISLDTYETIMNYRPGGIHSHNIETFREVAERAFGYLSEELNKIENGQGALVVAHSGTLRAVLFETLKDRGIFLPYPYWSPNNCSFAKFYFAEGKFHLIETHGIEFKTPPEKVFKCKERLEQSQQ